MTSPAEFFADAFAASPLMAIFRGLSPEETVTRANRAWDLGVRLVEVPVQDAAALPSLDAAVSAGRDRGMPVGAGTVVRPEQVTDVVRRGAAFTVAPGVHVDAIMVSRELGVPHLPGVGTSTEIAQAVSLGYSWLKAFPAAQLGPGWVRAQLAPFPEVRFVATGGVGSDNVGEMLAAGCHGVAMGTDLESYLRHL